MDVPMDSAPARSTNVGDTMLLFAKGSSCSHLCRAHGMTAHIMMYTMPQSMRRRHTHSEQSHRGDTMQTMQTRPKRSEVKTEDTWELETIYPTDDAWEADFQRVSAMQPGLAEHQGHMGDSTQSLLEALKRRDG